MSKKTLIMILQIIRIILILLICFAVILIGIVILAIIGVEIPNGEFITNLFGIPFLLFENKIAQIILLVIFIFVIVSNYFMKKNRNAK